jgi:hypothetical protein
MTDKTDHEGDMIFSCSLEKGTFDLIMTRFFQTVGYIEPRMALEIEGLLLEETEFGERVQIEAVLTEETVQ